MQIASAAIPNNLLQANVTQIVPIFSGGGTRLSAHIGIIKALQDMNVGFDTLVGVKVARLSLIFSFKPFKEHLLVDGAILSEDALFEDWRGDGTPSVCFRLQSTEQKRKAIKKNLLQLPQYVSMLIRTFMTAISREYVNAKYWHNTVVVNTGEISAVDFSLTPEIKNTLFELGYATTKEFLPKKCAGFMRSSAL